MFRRDHPANAAPRHNQFDVLHLSTDRPKFPRNYRLSSTNHSAYEVAVSYSRILCSSMPEGSSGSILEAKSASIISHVGGHGNSTI